MLLILSHTTGKMPVLLSALPIGVVPRSCPIGAVPFGVDPRSWHKISSCWCCGYQAQLISCVGGDFAWEEE